MQHVMIDSPKLTSVIYGIEFLIEINLLFPVRLGSSWDSSESITIQIWITSNMSPDLILIENCRCLH